MGRRSIRPARRPEYGIARGVLQRAVLARLLAGEQLTVVGRRDGLPRRAPAGMTPRSWDGFTRRLRLRGYRLECEADDYSHGIYDTYRLTRLLQDEGAHILV